MNYQTITKCRICERDDLDQVLDFGLSPLANAYPIKPNAPEDTYPLSVARCQACGHVQLEQTVEPEVLFKDYLYSSSDSPALVAHFTEFAKSVTQKLGLHDGSRILEVGCNDGGLLREFGKLGLGQLYGVEPAAHLAIKAARGGASVVNKFLNVEVSEAIRRWHGGFKLVCATNTYAHIADTAGFTQAVASLLDFEGVFVFENAYLLDTIQNLYFDQIYHEHLQYYGIKPLVPFLKKFGLEIFDVQHTPAQGGSVRVFVKVMGAPKWPIAPAVAEWIRKEEEAKLYEPDTYERFRLDLQAFAGRFDAMMADLSGPGVRFSCYGCPAKFTLMSKLLGLHRGNVDYVVDDSPMKQGRFAPGSKIPIVSGAHFRLHPTDYCIVTAWNMADAIIHRNPEFRGEWINPYSGIIKKAWDTCGSACNSAPLGV